MGNRPGRGRQGRRVMRLAVDGREFAAGARTGIGRYVLEVLRAAGGRGWHTTVYGDAATALPPGLTGVALARLSAPSTPLWDQVALPRALARDGADVFLSPYYKAPLAAPCPVAITIHDLYFIGARGRRRPVRDAALVALARLYVRRARAVVTDSEHSRRTIVARLGVDAAKVVVVPIAVGPEFAPIPPDAATRARYGLDTRYVLYLGNFKPHKNLERLLAAWAAVPAAIRAATRLALAGGDGAGRATLEARATALGIADAVVFPGRIADADLPALYAGATLLVLPSLEEGFGLPAVEAMACGTPVVVSNRGALPEVTGGAALAVDAEKEEAIAAGIVALLVDPVQRETLRRRGLVRAAAFVPAATSARVLDLLEQVARA